MRKMLSIVVLGCSTILASCAPQQVPHHATLAKPPPTPTKIDDPSMSCEEANRLAYKTVNVLGYTATSVTVAQPGQSGLIVAERDGTRGGRVIITCHSGGGASVEGQEGGLPIPSLVGGENPHKFYNSFRHSFNLLRQNEKIVAERGPEKGLTVKMTKLNSVESRIELGADLPAGGVLPIKVVITNNSPRPYGFDASQVFAMSAGGGRVAPSNPPAGQGKALHGEVTIAPGQTVTGYLFYPNGNYTSARTTVVDKENDEGEGVSVPF